nr:hypothetical protein Iba_scaffold46756CG0060 [Ipomoea batatas]
MPQALLHANLHHFSEHLLCLPRLLLPVYLRYEIANDDFHEKRDRTRSTYNRLRDRRSRQGEERRSRMPLQSRILGLKKTYNRFQGPSFYDAHLISATNYKQNFAAFFNPNQAGLQHKALGREIEKGEERGLVRFNGAGAEHIDERADGAGEVASVALGSLAGLMSTESGTLTSMGTKKLVEHHNSKTNPFQLEERKLGELWSETRSPESACLSRQSTSSGFQLDKV